MRVKITDFPCSEEGCTSKASVRHLCWAHYQRKWKAGEFYKPPTIEGRFWQKVNQTDDCWLWTGARTAWGYGSFQGGVTWSPHKFSYLLAFGEIPAEMDIDHLCHNADSACPGGRTCKHRLCVRPSHLEAVSHRENLLRGKTLPARNSRLTHCMHGHAYTGDNVAITKDGHRICRACRKAYAEFYRAKKR